MRFAGLCGVSNVDEEGNGRKQQETMPGIYVKLALEAATRAACRQCGLLTGCDTFCAV